MKPTFEYCTAAYLAPFSADTRATYAVGLRAWIRFCTRHNLDPWEVRRVHIEVWSRRLADEEGLARRSVAAALTPVCGAYDYAHAEGWLDINPAAHVRRPRIPAESSTLGLSRAELTTMLEFAAGYHDPYVSAVVTILGLNGTRPGETLRLDIADVGSHGALRTIKVRRKGDKLCILSLAPWTEQAVDRAIGDRTEGPLLLGPKGARMKQHQARAAVAFIANSVGVGRKITPRSLRNTFVTQCRDAGIPDRDIMASTGHLSPHMLDYYDRARAAVERNATHRLFGFLELDHSGH